MEKVDIGILIFLIKIYHFYQFMLDFKLAIKSGTIKSISSRGLFWIQRIWIENVN